MTTNKPEVFEVYRTRQGTLENVVLLADYEALQAEYEKLRKEAELKHAALEREVERLKKDAARLRPALEETVKSLEIISQQAGEYRGLSTFTQIKQYALDWVRTVRKDLAGREAE